MYLNYKPKHVVVYSKSEYLYDIFDKVLLSLGKVFAGNNFDYRTLFKFGKKIDDVRNKYPDNTIYIDSGGYSIIVGDIPEYSIPKLIELYTYFIENYHEKFDRVFSLDIPLSLKLDINYYDTLLKLNTESQQKTVEKVEKSDNLKSKIYFVWQFKTPNLFRIWNTVYNEMELWNKYELYSVGGLVGLKNFANINFSGYIVPVLYAVFLYLEKYDIDELHKKYGRIPYHILGQYASVDQLSILVIEKYIEEKFSIKLDITYDSAAIHSEFINLKDKDLHFYTYDGTKLLTINELDEILDDIHFHISNNKEIFYEVANCIKSGKRMNDIDAARFIYGLHIVSREYEFSKLVNDIVEILISNTKLNAKLSKLESYLKYIRLSNNLLKAIITNNLIKSFINNMKALVHFSVKYNPETKEKAMEKWIELISLKEFIIKKT